MAAALLASTSLDDMRTAQSITTLNDSATVEQALKVLASKRVLSAPVRRAGAAPDGAGASIRGFVDVRDVAASLFRLSLAGVDLGGMKMLQRMRVLEERGAQFALAALRDLPILGGDGGFYHLRAGDASLLEVVEHGLLAPPDAEPSAAAPPPQQQQQQQDGGNGGNGSGRSGLLRAQSMRAGPRRSAVVHRLALYDDQERVVNIVSQTDIVRFLAANRRDLGPLAAATAAELGWAPRAVVTVTPDVPAVEALALMDDKGISAVAVVDAAGRIIGNFSVSEVRSIMAEHFGALALPVAEFLALEHGTEFAGYARMDEGVRATAGGRFATDRAGRAARPRTPGDEVGQSLVLVGPDATFGDVAERIAAHRIHRVYVVDAAGRPVGCATCTDVLRAVVADGRRGGGNSGGGNGGGGNGGGGNGGGA